MKVLFQYLLLLRGATSIEFRFIIYFNLFQYLLLLRGATWHKCIVLPDSMFQYLLLLRGATGTYKVVLNTQRFQYLLLLRGATFAARLKFRNRGSFNTCSSCEEQHHSPIFKKYDRVSIPAPLARSNACPVEFNIKIVQFQYLLLLRGATCIVCWILFIFFRFNTCSSCEEQLAKI